MKRRHLVQALLGAPAASALIAQQTGPEELPKLGVSGADAVAEMTPRYFSNAQFAALRKVSDLLAPAINGIPGATDAKAPEFLDFLIGESPADRQQVYKQGLDALNAQAGKRFHKAFADLDNAQAEVLLAPLREPWTFDPPADPLARFLWAAKQDVRTATINSREYSLVAGARVGGRRSGGGLYWYPLD
jgi:hypothetical protein